MTAFRVWAPNAGCVEIALGRRVVEMRPDADGWWQLEVAEAGPGSDYAYVLDGGDPLPDPRSSWQPAGIHGPSRVVDHAAFQWSDAGWQARPLAEGVVYELHVGTFTPGGTFDSAIARLDQLVELGVTHVELMPVNEFPGNRGWGYDGVGLYAPHHAYGGPEGLKRLVDAGHKKGLAVLLDVVYNHLGPAGNYLGHFGPYFTESYTTPWGPAINLDGAGSDEVRSFFIDNALMWLRDYHFDGLRLDAIHAIFDRSATHFLEELCERVAELEAALGRHLILIAESDLNDPRVVRRRELGGYGMHAQWSDDFHHALHTVLSGESSGYYVDFGGLADLSKALRHAFVYDGAYSRHRRRRHGRPIGDLSGHRFLGYLQNHDQIGNRARGERSSHLLSIGRIKVGATMVLTAPFVPMLFQGEEWAASTPFQYFTDHRDPSLGRAVTEGRRKEFAAFGWKPEEVPDPQAPETFERSRLRWEERNRDQHAELLEWHRKLIALRRSTPALLDGRLDLVRTDYDQTAGWFIMRRGPIAVVLNLAEQAQVVTVRPGHISRIMLASHEGVTLAAGGVHMPPESVVILELGGLA